MADPRPTPDPRTGPEAIWAPWRLEYLERVSAEERAQAAPAGPAAAREGGDAALCFLRANWLDPAADVRNHIIVRSARGMVLLNRYPYANGHLLVALGEGRARLLDYDEEDRRHFWRLVDAAVDLAETALEPQGINAGINQGRAAGAGVPDHLHAHIVPRWSGDTNFITTVGQIRVVPAALEAMATRMRAAWAAIEPRWRDALSR